MSFLFPELQCMASGLDLRWMLLSSSLAYLTPLSGLSKSLPLSVKSPVSRCLPPSSCPLLFIAPCNSLSSSLYYAYMLHFLFLYLSYPLQAPDPTPSISLCNDCTTAFIDDRVLRHYTACHFATSPLIQKSITHQIKQ